MDVERESSPRVRGDTLMSWGFTRVVKQVQKQESVDKVNVKVKGKRKRKSASNAKCVSLAPRPIVDFDHSNSIRKFIKVRRLTSEKL